MADPDGVVVGLAGGEAGVFEGGLGALVDEGAVVGGSGIGSGAAAVNALSLLHTFSKGELRPTNRRRGIDSPGLARGARPFLAATAGRNARPPLQDKGLWNPFNP